MKWTRADSAPSALRRRQEIRRVPLSAYPAVALVYVYRWTLRPLLGGSCKYHPSCSEYALDAYRRYGFLKGTVLAGWRLLRCNPWSHGGVDYAKDQRLFA